MEKISKEQLNRLLKILRDTDILFEWIYGLCQISCLTDLTVTQYNYLLAIISQSSKVEMI